jgi:hypothetical protein
MVGKYTRLGTLVVAVVIAAAAIAFTSTKGKCVYQSWFGF